MRKALVTVSSDGTRDFVTMPDGQKLILGTVSVLRFVTETTPHLRLVRQILDQFLKTGEALFTVNLDRMDKLLTPRRARWSSEAAIPLMESSDRTSIRKPQMSDTNFSLDVLHTRLASMEAAVAKLDKLASESLISPKLHAGLRALACESIPSETSTVASPVVDAPVATPSVDALQANASLADEVLSTVEATGEKIDQLVTAGRKFNASKARQDLYAIAHKTAEILNNVDLAQPWVQQDLSQLADDANKIHALFASAKV